MDIVSHGLWGGVAFGRDTRRTFWLAVFFGMLPDLLSFGVYMVARIAGISPSVEWSGGPPPLHDIPGYVSTLYNVSHNLVTFVVVGTLLWMGARTYAKPFLAYGLHILVDIPTHSTAFFPTPFLWPVSSYAFDGVPWSSPYIFFPNLILLVIAYTMWYRTLQHRRES